MKNLYLILSFVGVNLLNGQFNVKPVFDDSFAFYTNQRGIVKQSLENKKIIKHYKLSEQKAIIDSVYLYTIQRQKSWHDSDRLNCRNAIQRSALFVNLGMNNGHVYALMQYEKKYVKYAEVFFALIEFDQDLNFLNYYIKPKYNHHEFNNAIYGLTFNNGKLWLANYTDEMCFQAYELNAKKHFLDTSIETPKFESFLKGTLVSVMSNQHLVFFPYFKIVFNQGQSYICQFPLAVLQSTENKVFKALYGNLNSYNEQLENYNKAKKNKASHLRDISNQSVPFNPRLIAIDDLNQQITALCYDSTLQKLVLFKMNNSQEFSQQTYNLTEKMNAKSGYALNGDKVYFYRKNEAYLDIKLLHFE